MKKFYYIFTILTIISSAMMICACNGDNVEDVIENGNGSDYLELTIDGKTYHKKLLGIYTEIEVGENDMVITGTTEDVFDDEGFNFFLTIAHSEKKEKLLKMSPGSYKVSEYLDYEEDPEPFTLYPDFEKNRNIYSLVNGNHDVKSIKQTKNGVQIVGTFNLNMAYEGKSVQLKGKYGITVL